MEAEGYPFCIPKRLPTTLLPKNRSNHFAPCLQYLTTNNAKSNNGIFKA